MNQQQQYKTEQAPAWGQLSLWIVAEDDPPIIEVDDRQAPMRCPLCCAVMAAGAQECPNCGMVIDL